MRPMYHVGAAADCLPACAPAACCSASHDWGKVLAARGKVHRLLSAWRAALAAQQRTPLEQLDEAVPAGKLPGTLSKDVKCSRGVLFHFFGDAMCREDRHGAIWDFIDFIDEHGTLCA